MILGIVIGVGVCVMLGLLVYGARNYERDSILRRMKSATKTHVEREALNDLLRRIGEDT